MSLRFQTWQRVLALLVVGLIAMGVPAVSRAQDNDADKPKPRPASQPLVIFNVASVDRLIGDVRYLFEASGQPQITGYRDSSTPPPGSGFGSGSTTLVSPIDICSPKLPTGPRNRSPPTNRRAGENTRKCKNGSMIRCVYRCLRRQFGSVTTGKRSRLLGEWSNISSNSPPGATHARTATVTTATWVLPTRSTTSSGR